jgi:ureidoglycolate lyase
MRENQIIIRPLTRENFAAFGDVIETEQRESFPINQGLTQRYHALSLTQLGGENGAVGLSIFHNLQATSLPFNIYMLERHPLGSQSFIPLAQQKFIIVVALPLNEAEPDEAKISAFLSNGQQGITYHQGVWHHPLITLEAESDFLVVDRIGLEPNCDIHDLSRPIDIIESFTQSEKVGL